MTINPEEELVMANLVSSEFSSNYAPYADLKGAAYYEMEGGGALVKNPRYPDAPPVRYCNPVEVPELGIERGGSGSTIWSGGRDRSRS